MGEERKIVKYELEDLLRAVIKHNASDLHIKAESPPIVRLEGELVPIGDKPLSVEDCENLIFSILDEKKKENLFQGKELDFAYSISGGRFRVNVFLQGGIVSAAFRQLYLKIPSVEELNLPPVIKTMAEYNNGLILVTGPAGCGKSTTLASIIEHINQTRKVHIITLEDPIEFVHKGNLSIITQREIGRDTISFSEGLRQSLRQDPNVILIGEMRDPETIMTAVIAAETGHLVLSTLHTPNAVQAIDRIIDIFSGDQQKQFRLLLANTLRGIISQKLLPRTDIAGRIPAVEVMIVSPTIRSLILESKTNEIYQYIAQGSIYGMITFTDSLKMLYDRGYITKEEALYYADQPTELRLNIEGHTTKTVAEGEDSLIDWI